MWLGSLSDMSGMALKVTISSPEPELPLASGTGKSLMLTKRIAAFVNEIVDTIKYDKDNTGDTIKHWQLMKVIENFMVRSV